MSEPVFDVSAEGWWTLRGNPSIGYHTPKPGPQSSFSLSASWQNGDATYCFLPTPAPADFAGKLASFLARFAGAAAPRFLWIANPDSRVGEWTISRLDTVAHGDGWAVARRNDFDLDGYALTIRGGGAVEVGEDRAGWGFYLDDPSAPAAMLRTPAGSAEAQPATTSLCMDGDAAGCWRFAFEVAAGLDAFALLDCGIRYFMPDPETGAILSVPLTTFRQPPDRELTFHATLDPLRLRNPDRSHFGLFRWDGVGPAVELQSGFATARGYGVDLIPVANGIVPARLVFHFAPSDSLGPSGSGTATARGRLYLAPQGAFTINVLEPDGPHPDPVRRLICGTAGLEYLGVAKSGTQLHFVAQCNAYAPGVAQPDPTKSLTGLGDTAWGYCAVTYYAQPEDAPLYSASNAATARAGYLNFLEVPAAALPAADGVRAFPIAPFRDLAPALTAAALALEKAALAPTRRLRIKQIAGALLDEPAREARWRTSLRLADTDADTIGVTPQGLAVGIGANGHWNWVGIAHSGPADAEKPDLRFSQAEGDLREALQTNNLFMVLGNAAEFGKSGSVRYRLTAHDLNLIWARLVRNGFPPLLFRRLGAVVDREFATRTHFVNALREVWEQITDVVIGIFAAQAGLLTALIHDWAFKLAPDTWTEDDRQTYLVFKFALGRPLSDLVSDVGAWAWPAAASPATAGSSQASGDLLAILAAARDKADPASPNSPLANLIRIADDPDWTGIIAFSAAVPLDVLPGPLQALAAGIDPAAFYAHHIGFPVTPFQLSAEAVPKLAFKHSATFGLIDYENPVDQYFASDIDFAFRVLQLTVAFRNAAITSFTSRVELMANKLFGAATRLFPADHGNNMILAGAYQQQIGRDGLPHDSYIFAGADDYRFLLAGGALEGVEILSIQLLTTKAVAPGDTDLQVNAVFQMAGALRFHEFDAFDPFCWGPAASGPPPDPMVPSESALRFGGLAVAMDFSLADPAGTTRFTAKEGDLSFDMANSLARPDSLFKRFPVRLKRLIATAAPAPGAADTAGPDSLGFVTIGTPIDQSKLAGAWYGLNYTIDLGSLGALAGSSALTLELLAGWGPAEAGAEPPVYVGVKLPGVDGKFGTSLPLQGILKLGFKSMEFLTDEDLVGSRRYTLRLRDFAIKLLSLTFPPGRNEIYLFGNPDQSADAAVGWYAAYSQDSDPKAQSTALGRRHVRAARAALRRPGSNVAGGAGRG